LIETAWGVPARSLMVVAGEGGREPVAQVGVGGIAGGRLLASGEQGVEGAVGRVDLLLRRRVVGWDDGVEQHGADAFRVRAHDLLGEQRRVGHGGQRPAGDAHGHPDIGDVGGVGDRVIGGQIDTGGFEALLAGLDRRGDGGVFRRIGVAPTQIRPDRVVSLGTVEARLAVAGAALIDVDEVVSGQQRIGVLAVGTVLCLQRTESRTSRQAHDRTAGTVRRRRQHAGHGQMHLGAGRVGSVLRHGHRAALDLGVGQHGHRAGPRGVRRRVPRHRGGRRFGPLARTAAPPESRRQHRDDGNARGPT